MSAPQCTPGPWSVEVSSNTSATVRVVHTVDGDGVGDDVCVVGDVRVETNRANAALIAAAPALYAELEESDALLVRFRDALKTARRTGDYSPALALLADEFAGEPRRRSALAQARGEVRP